MIDLEILRYYNAGKEGERLSGPYGELERVRTQEVIQRLFPPSPANVLDVGGGTGPYALWLLECGYEVQLLDPIPLHVEEAKRNGISNAAVGDARALGFAEASFDAVLMLGPLYHLIDSKDRAASLREARRVLRPGGVLVAAGISRFASLG